MADFELTGDWEGFSRLLSNAASNFKKNVKAATDQAGRLIEGRIVTRIQSNQVTPATSPESKAWKEKYGFSDTTLIMTSSLLGAIKYSNVSWDEGFVGVKRAAESRAAVRREKRVAKAVARYRKKQAKKAGK